MQAEQQHVFGSFITARFSHSIPHVLVSSMKEISSTSVSLSSDTTAGKKHFHFSSAAATVVISSSKRVPHLNHLPQRVTRAPRVSRVIAHNTPRLNLRGSLRFQRPPVPRKRALCPTARVLCLLLPYVDCLNLVRYSLLDSGLAELSG